MKYLQKYGKVLSGILAGASALAGLPAAAQTGPIEEVVVVGSRISKPDFAFSNPVQSIESDTIRFSGTTNLGNFLKEFPALTGSLDANDAAGSNTFIGGTGLSLLNLRNLGVERTLVLVDGRRHVAALPGSAAVDIDTIPIELIERVEILTGGASAVYGADGVSGVVNFVMKDDFEGLSINARAGQSAENDGQTGLFSATAGTSLFDDRGHAALAVEWSREEDLHANDRDFAGGGRRYSFMNNPCEDFPEAQACEGSPQSQKIPLRDIRFFDSSPEGAVDVDFDFWQDFNGTDTPWDEGTIPFINPYYAQGGDGTRTDQYIGDLLPEEERVMVNGFFDYQITDRINFFSEIKYARNDSLSRSQPSFDFFLFLEPDYAYYPPNIAAALGTDSEEPQPALVSRDHFDLGVRSEDIERETLRGVFGIEGDLADNLSYEVSYVYGETDVANKALNNRINDRFAAALDAVVDPQSGNVVCRSTLDPDALPYNLDWQGWIYDYAPDWAPGDPWARTFTPGAGSGCVPLNVIGSDVASRAARDWIMADTTADSTIEQRVAQAYLTGDTAPWFNLPAGPVGFAAGLEYREERSSSVPAALDRAGVTFGNQLEPVRGDYDVKEVFAEINVPVLSDLPGVRELNFDAAMRLSDYSTIGNADTWKLGLSWSPIDDIMLRGTLAEATRSPNIGELFDPGGQTFEGINDPCDIANLENGTEFRADNCAQILADLGVDPTTFVDPNSSFVPGTLAGNPDLSEEVAETRTIGVILNPRWVPDLTISIDWYDIDLEDAINTATPEEAAQTCVDLPTVDNEFCTLITREDGTGALIDFVQRPQNVAEFNTEGYDFTIDYAVDPTEWGLQRNIGLFNLRLVGNHLKELQFINLPGAPPDDELSEVDAPEWQFRMDLTWEYSQFLVNYSLSWFDETLRYTNLERQSAPDLVEGRFWEYDERRVHDIHVAYEHRPGLEIYAGVNNLTDQQPDIGAVFYPVSAVGRFFYLGLGMDFDLFN